MPLVARPLSLSNRMGRRFASKTFYWIPIFTIYLALFPCVPTPDQGNPASSPPQIAGSDTLGKPCFVVGNFPIPQSAKTNPNVQCVPDGRQTFPPIPELLLNGTNYSSIDYQSEKNMSAVYFAFRKLSPKGHTREEGLEYLATYISLYESMQLALRSIGPRAPKNAIATAKGVLAFLSMNVALLKLDVPQVKVRLQSTLKLCVDCSVQEKYNLIIFAAGSGFDPESVLRELEGSGCQSSQQCAALQRMEADRRNSKNTAVLSTFLLKSEASSSNLGLWRAHAANCILWLVMITKLVIFG
ncbi:hypothetical protein CROQUDRAFT_102921 [Cronartium quercuum f. sp. fusiforme G11]|uniref:DUF7143 domain-containing protein n=1 Tax=Cronartium quercuum f. sp. fusiforme G11 TaxID=708437 RepID=A0A9P6NS44_9BASI|nr:hypothetical protein CROQUDRAFT_102921 [Cronartium quercuum f. sp. fusiforme G11]